MAEADPKKINIKIDIPTGKTVTPEPKPVSLEMPPPPMAGNAPKVMQKSAPKDPLQIGLPPLPNDLKPITAQQEQTAPPRQTLSTPPVAHPPILPQPISSAVSKFAPPPEQPPVQGMPPQPETQTIEVPKEPVHDPLQKELKRRISQVKGPVFISLERYREVKNILNSLKDNSRNLREIMDDLKNNKKEGAELLTNSVDKLEHIEEDVENINATLRV